MPVPFKSNCLPLFRKHSLRTRMLPLRWLHLVFIALTLTLFARMLRRAPHVTPFFAARPFLTFRPRTRGEARQTGTIQRHRKREVVWARPDAPNELVLGIRRDALSSAPVRRIRVLPQFGALFCPIPGVASRALLRALERAEGVGEDELPSLSEYALRDRERFLVRPEVFRFVFVRHPFARLLSAFYAGHSFSSLDNPAYREFMGHVRGRPLAPDEHELQPLSFLFFLTFLNKQRRGDLWDRFMPQTDLCGFEAFEYAFVGRLEQLEQDVAKVEQRLAYSLRPLQPALFSSNASETFPEMFTSRNRRTKAMKLYDTDLRQLGYSPVF